MMTRRHFFGLSVLVPGAAVLPSKVAVPEDVRTVEVRPDRAYIVLANRYSQTDFDKLAEALKALGVRAAIVLTDDTERSVRALEMELPREDPEQQAARLAREAFYCHGSRHVFRSHGFSCQCGEIVAPTTAPTATGFSISPVAAKRILGS